MFGHAMRQAPARFDPAAVTQPVLVEDWTIQEVTAPRREVIVGTVWHHPHIADGRRTHTTELIWIDEKLGWARSLFRFYRLGQQANLTMKGNDMRIFLAGATGVIGTRLIPLMLAEGHTVAAMTRTPSKVDGLRAAGITPVLCDLFDRPSLVAAVKEFRPDVVAHQVTDLPDDIGKLAEFLAKTGRVRSEGTQNLLAAARAAEASGFIAQSIAWGADAVLQAHETAVLSAGGTVLRYGQFYGPGTFYENEPPPAPRIQVDEAARRTMPFLAGPRGTFTITDETA